MADSWILGWVSPEMNREDDTVEQGLVQGPGVDYDHHLRHVRGNVSAAFGRF